MKAEIRENVTIPMDSVYNSPIYPYTSTVPVPNIAINTPRGTLLCQDKMCFQSRGNDDVNRTYRRFWGFLFLIFMFILRTDLFEKKVDSSSGYYVRDYRFVRPLPVHGMMDYVVLLSVLDRNTNIERITAHNITSDNCYSQHFLKCFEHHHFNPICSWGFFFYTL
jgi:hypothetical protein